MKTFGCPDETPSCAAGRSWRCAGRGDFDQPTAAPIHPVAKKWSIIARNGPRNRNPSVCQAERMLYTTG